MGYHLFPLWNCGVLLEPDELCRHIREVHHTGLGDFFMHVSGRGMSGLFHKFDIPD